MLYNLVKLETLTDTNVIATNILEQMLYYKISYNYFEDVTSVFFTIMAE
jgi:hypothetical protein